MLKVKFFIKGQFYENILIYKLSTDDKKTIFPCNKNVKIEIK